MKKTCILIMAVLVTLGYAQEGEVELEIQVSYDPPSPTAEGHKVFLIDPATSMTYCVWEGTRVKPGAYHLVIESPGYYFGHRKPLEIPAGTASYTIREKLMGKKRPLAFCFYDGQSRRLIPARSVSIDGRFATSQDAFPVGAELSMVAEFEGREPVRKQIVIPPGEGTFVERVPMDDLSSYLTPATGTPREIKLAITGDYPPDEMIDPEVASIDGKDVCDNLFAPGRHVLSLRQPGFFPVQKSLTISPGKEPYVIAEELISMPRKVKTAIGYDVSPTARSPRITMAPAATPTEEAVIRDGDNVKPGTYILRITQESYEPAEMKKYVWPDEMPLEIRHNLIAKNVELRIEITYDVPPTADLAECKVMLVDEAGISRYVTSGTKVKPGAYNLVIERPGYSYGAPKPIYIAPSEEPYFIVARLLAKVRRGVSFDIVDPDTQALVPIYRVLYAATGKEMTFQDRFQPGEQLDLLILFKKYQTVRISVVTSREDGPMVVKVPPLTRLKAVEFSVRHSGKEFPKIELDGIMYPYAVQADFSPIEAHHITAEKGASNRYFYTVMVPPTATAVQVFGGYLFTQRPLDSHFTMSEFGSISVPKLMEHLEHIANSPGQGQGDALVALEKNLQDGKWLQMLDQCDPQAIAELKNHLASWQVADEERERLDLILDRLGNIRH